MRGAEHERLEPVPALFPFLTGCLHVHGQDEVRHAARMRQRHHLTGRQEVLEAEMPVAARQRLAARADHQPADALCQAKVVDRLHDRQLDHRIGAREHGQAGDLGARLRGHRARQRDAAFDHQRLAAAGLDACRADGLAAGLVPHQQHGGVQAAVQRLHLGEMRHRLTEVVTIGLRPHLAGFGQFGFGTGDADVETQLGSAHVRAGGGGGHAGRE